jgi:methionine-S-sulfoxide reductase
VRTTPTVLLLALLSGACGARPGAAPAQERAPMSDETRGPESPAAEALATFGGGCFWCVEAVFRELAGVLSVAPGYSGGSAETATYEQVCSGRTGHAEVIQIRFDPRRVPYATLLEVFFRTHDPTTLNRQGNDRGTQYRSVVFAHDEAQRAAAEAAIAAVDEAGVYDGPVVTQVVPFEAFHPAEEYHHDYFARNPQNAYCAAVIPPKLAKLRKAFEGLLRKP